MRVRWLWLRGLWWRRGLTAAVLVVATVTIGAAALGPLYARAAGESTLHDQLAQADPADAGLRLLAYANPFGDGSQIYGLPVRQVFDMEAATTPTGGAIHGYPTRIAGITLPVTAAAPNVSGLSTKLAWREGVCAHVRLSAGRCPRAADEIMVSRRTAAYAPYGWQLGTVLTTAVTNQHLRIVGVYEPLDVNGSYWFDPDYFDARSGSGNGPGAVDAVFAPEAAFDHIVISDVTGLTISFEYPIDVDAVSLADVPRLRSVIAHDRRQYQGTDIAFGTRVDRVLDAARHQRRLVDTGTLLVTLQLALLAWLVLFDVLTDAVEARGAEIALAKLRGYRPRRVLAFALGPPLVIMLAAVPIGVLLAFVAARLFASHVLAPGTPVAFTVWTALAAAGAVAGGLVAAALASVRTLRRTVLQQWRRTERRTATSRVALAVDAVIAAAALAGVLRLRLGAHEGASGATSSLLAPGLLVLAVALLGTRLLPLAARLLVRPTRRTARVGLFLAVRNVVRRPSGLRLAALLAVAVGLATFAVGGAAVAAGNRDARARAEVGAARVAPMQFARGIDPVAAVRTADPHGQWGMAAATWLPDGGDSVVGTVLGVDASRLAAVAYGVRGGPSLTALAHTIGGTSVPQILFGSGGVRLSITASAMSGTAPGIVLLVRTGTEAYHEILLGSLKPGRHDYVGAVTCPGECLVRGIVWQTTGPGTIAVATVVVHALDHRTDPSAPWTPVDAGLSRTGAWRGGPEVSESKDVVTATPDGLRDQYRSASGHGGVSAAYTPVPLPAVATPAAVLRGPTAPNPPQMVDALDTIATFSVRQWVPVLPAVLDNGIMLDLTFLDAVLPNFVAEANWSVWLGPRAPPDALARLQAAGLSVQPATTTTSRIVLLGRQGPALSLVLLLACAIVGAFVAVGGTAVAIAAGARRRSFETAALRAVGVRRRLLYRGSLWEQMLLLGSAVVLGVPAGFLGVVLVMPVIPEFADRTPVPLVYHPPSAPVLVFAAAFALVVVATALVCAGAVLHAARPTRLRQAEE